MAGLPAGRFGGAADQADPRAAAQPERRPRLRSLPVDAPSREGSAIWTRTSVQRLIKRVFGVHLSPVSVGRVLERIGIPQVNALTRFKEAEAAGRWPAGTLAAVREQVRAGFAVHYLWVGPLPAYPPAPAPAGTLVTAGGGRAELRFRASRGESGTAAFLHMCRVLVEETRSPATLVAESGPASLAPEVTRFFASAKERLSLLPSLAELADETFQNGFGRLSFGGRGVRLRALHDRLLQQQPTGECRSASAGAPLAAGDR